MTKQEKREAIRMMFGGKCAYCGEELPLKGWHMDHVDPVVRCYATGTWTKDEKGFSHYTPGPRRVKRLDNPDGMREDNLWPSCHRCNINKSSMSIETWRKFLMDGPESLASYNGRFRHMLRFNVVTVNPEPLWFWFEKYRATQGVHQ